MMSEKLISPYLFHFVRVWWGVAVIFRIQMFRGESSLVILPATKMEMFFLSKFWGSSILWHYIIKWSYELMFPQYGYACTSNTEETLLRNFPETLKCKNLLNAKWIDMNSLVSFSFEHVWYFGVWYLQLSQDGGYLSLCFSMGSTLPFRIFRT